MATVRSNVGGQSKLKYPPNSGASGTASIGTTAAQITATATICDFIWLQARRGNAGYIGIGFANTVDGGVGSQNCPVLAAGQSVSFRIADLSDLWFEADTAGQNLDYLYTTYDVDTLK